MPAITSDLNFIVARVLAVVGTVLLRSHTFAVWVSTLLEVGHFLGLLDI
jgi:hypothetical protein